MSDTNTEPRGAAFCPVLRYSDPDAAIEWLAAAFGFRAGMVSRGAEGEVAHAELNWGASTLMLGAGTAPEAIDGAGTYVVVEDPDAHCARARQAGAEITMELTDQPYGSREYAAKDLEGNNWFFGTYAPDPASSA